MNTSYHVHSRWSDGQKEIEDYIRVAQEIGLSEIGISDHYVISPLSRNLEWAMAPDALNDYVEAVQSASGVADDNLIVRLGIETDFFPETINELRDVLKTQPFDYVIGSVHFLDDFPIDEGGDRWEDLSVKERDDVHRGYWVRIREMAESGAFDFAGHLDLTKKFGYCPTVDLSSEISAALDAIARADMAIELNTAGWYAPAKEEYPSSSILKGAFERGIPVLITADAHTPENLTRSFEDACSLLMEIGYDKTVSFAGRQRYEHKLING